ncbi:hypothetical protein C5167_047892 [Papaver somniferum]|uniref:Uncharacterized protein n=1 Tax=Papaver somniferum TaxID=3469 RepID=A0A4Y7LJG8_PAPSO|nr:uncharacterized protein LOC113323824 [Papaver somniferum]RZC85107.1 hypothetical protein C5167_047892 [Papaver somniferum]
MKSTRLAVWFINISLLLFICLNTVVNADDQQKQNPNAVERGIGITSTPWNTVKSWLKVALMNFKPPDSQSMPNKEASNSGELMKDAVSKSFKTSTDAAKETAKAAGDAIHSTAEKVMKKTGISSSEEDEL